ncbi:MAG TPA: hypothetical protein VK897_05415 [Anaerolineales bacterium]|nr:hypothetical protein [Anaerolineales bacterium]
MKQQSSKAVQPIFNGLALDWHKLGEIELPFGADTSSTVNAWILETLDPMGPHLDLLNKILKSAKDAVAHAKQTETIIEQQHIHLCIYLQGNHPCKAQTWGFFRIEKVEPAVENGPSRDRSIEFYLYPEK